MSSCSMALFGEQFQGQLRKIQLKIKQGQKLRLSEKPPQLKCCTQIHAACSMLGHTVPNAPSPLILTLATDANSAK